MAFFQEKLLGTVYGLSAVKSTDYFRNVVPRKHPEVRLEWVQQVLANPVKRSTQVDGRIIYWANIAENDGRALRVVTLEDGETVHNAFFDRSFYRCQRRGEEPQ